MEKYMTQEEHDKIIELWEQGMPQKDIATRLRRSPSAICYVINHAPGVRKIPKPPRKDRYVYEELEEIDLSKLPNDAYFKHDKTFVF